MAVPQTLPPKIKDPSKFTISYNIGGVKISHALCDLGSSISVMLLNNVKELKIGEIIPSNMTLTLADSSVTQPLGILRWFSFPAYFVVLNEKGDSRGYVILRRPFSAIEKAKIDVETGELFLKFNK